MTAAEQILDALKLVVGKDVNEYAIPVINTIIEKHESAQLSAKEQECEELKKHFEKEKEEMVISSNKLATKVADQLDELSYLRAERDELKKALGGGMYSEQKKVIAVLDNEITLLRAENERLKDQLRREKEDVKSLEIALQDKDRKLYNNDLASLRKRCEDLEALNYEFQDTLKSILDTSEMVPSIKEEAEKLLNGNQIKS